MKRRALLVGTGQWAEEHLRAYARCRAIEVVGLCGHADEAALHALADAHGIAFRGLDLAEALRALEPEIVDVVTSPQLRLEAVRAAAAAGVAAVNLEKPLALRPSQARAIAEVCRRSGLLLTVNHQKKLLPAWAAARQVIAGGRLGPLRFLRASCKGNLLEQGTHLLDMLLHFHPRPLREVLAQVGELEGLRKPGAAAPDTAAALLRFDDGVPAYLTAGSCGWEVAGAHGKWNALAVEAYGEDGHLSVALDRSLDVTTYADGRRSSQPSDWSATVTQALAEHLDGVARYVADPAGGHPCDLRRSLASFEAVMAVYASAVDGGAVTLPRRFDDRVVDALHDRLAAGGRG